jgi:hypothetical protein
MIGGLRDTFKLRQEIAKDLQKVTYRIKETTQKIEEFLQIFNLPP